MEYRFDDDDFETITGGIEVLLDGSIVGTYEEDVETESSEAYLECTTMGMGNIRGASGSRSAFPVKVTGLSDGEDLDAALIRYRAVFEQDEIAGRKLLASQYSY